MSQIELPPKYYLAHFQEFVLVLKKQLHHLLGETHLSFLNQFGRLSEDAQCLYVRMVNRKGILFTKEEMTYAEIKNQAGALTELLAFGFAESFQQHHVPAAIYKMTKAEVADAVLAFAEDCIFVAHNVAFRWSLSGPRRSSPCRIFAQRPGRESISRGSIPMV